MRIRFTTIADVAAALIDAEPAFAEILTQDELYDVIRSNHEGRYEEITDEEFDEMYQAAMALANSRSHTCNTFYWMAQQRVCDECGKIATSR